MCLCPQAGVGSNGTSGDPFQPHGSGISDSLQHRVTHLFNRGQLRSAESFPSIRGWGMEVEIQIVKGAWSPEAEGAVF